MKQIVFPVEIGVVEEDALTERLTAVQQWLDRNGFSPVTFRYAFGSSVIRLSVDFSSEAEAIVFATAFDGRTVSDLGSRIEEGN